MASVLEELAKPHLEPDDDLDMVKWVMELVQVGWNLSRVDPIENGEALHEALDGMSPDVLELVQDVCRCAVQRFPDDPRRVERLVVFEGAEGWAIRVFCR